MATIDAASTGRAALEAGRWDDARLAFTASLDGGASAGALDGLAEALWWLGESRASVRCREQAFVQFRRDGDDDAACRAAIDLSIGYLLNLGNVVAARGWLARADRLARAADATRPSPHSGWLWLMQGYTATDPTAAHDLTRRALDHARSGGDVDLELVALGDVGFALVSEGHVEQGFNLLDEAMAGTLGGECRRRDTVVFTSCTMLAACSLVGDFERAAQWCRAAEEFMEQYGCPFLRARCRAHYGGILVAKGRWGQAEEELDAALRMSHDTGPGPRNEALTHLADLRVRQGRLEDAEVVLARLDDPNAAAIVRSMLWLARRQPNPAVAILERRLATLGERNIELAPTLAALTDALISQGDLSAADDAVQRLDALVDDGDNRAAALAHGARGRLAAAGADDPDSAISHFELALDCLASLGLPLETARVRLDLARLLASDRPELAIDMAAAARATFERLRADLDADAAVALLRSLGAATPPGPRQLGLLTKREQDVLALVGRGLTNPQIGERLYISRKTVSHHVSNLLAKLGLHNRAELVVLVAGGTPEDDHLRPWTGGVRYQGGP